MSQLLHKRSAVLMASRYTVKPTFLKFCRVNFERLGNDEIWLLLDGERIFPNDGTNVVCPTGATKFFWIGRKMNYYYTITNTFKAI